MDTEPVQRRSIQPMAMALMVSLVAGCALLTHEAGPTGCADASSRPATLVARPAVPIAQASASNVVVQVNSTLANSVRLTVRFDELLALDIRVPGTDARCFTQPVYRYGYRLPPGQVDVKATSDSSQDGAATLHVEEQKRWLVIVVQKGFPLSVREWRERPAWG